MWQLIELRRGIVFNALMYYFPHIVMVRLPINIETECLLVIMEIIITLTKPVAHCTCNLPFFVKFYMFNTSKYPLLKY